MKLTNQILTNLNACNEAVVYFEKNELEGRELKYCIKKAMKDNYWSWCNWLVVRLMTREQQIQYAVFAAEQVISIFEKKYPKDTVPRKAIAAAKNYLKNPSEKNKNAANAANAAAYAAANAAANAAYAAAYAANAAAYAAANAAYAEMKTKIINYSIKLIESKNE